LEKEKHAIRFNVQDYAAIAAFLNKRMLFGDARESVDSLLKQLA